MARAFCGAGILKARVKGEKAVDTAWSGPRPKRWASRTRDYVAFWKDIEVES